jgi:hypothetical protein
MVIGLFPLLAMAQNAALSGVVRDTQGEVVANADARLVEQGTGVTLTTQSNDRGIYAFPSVRPATYNLEVVAPGFAPAARIDLVLTVDQRASLDISLTLAGRIERVDVHGQGAMLGTVDGSVGTVIDRQFAAELPVRGRSFSALVALAPGMNRIPGALGSGAGSEFGANGQRDTSNSLTVDGVAGQSEMGPGGLGNGAGQRFSSTETGTVNGGLSLDAVQEIRIQTSSFAAEFGRTPGAQISLVTRSGTNRLRGSLFEQFRGDRLMANDWFANSRGVAKPSVDEHQFGGALGGPVVPGRLFYFLSYEGLRLTQPQFQIVRVPSLEARQQESPLHDVLNAYPLPSGPSRPDLSAERAAYDAQHHSSDTWGIRLDQVLTNGVQVFGRYSRTPSTLVNDFPLAIARTLGKHAQSITGSLTATVGAKMLIEARGNYGDSDYGYGASADEGFRRWFPANDGSVSVGIRGLNSIIDGRSVHNIQRQANYVGAVSYVDGAHQLKAGLDYRRLQPSVADRYSIGVVFQDVRQAVTGSTASALNVFRARPNGAVFGNLSLYAQDTWKAHRRLSVTYGLRWDLNPAPAFAEGGSPLAATAFEPISTLTVAATSNPLWDTNYRNVSPRVGVSYAIDSEARSILSGGAGLFSDIESTAVQVSQVLFGNSVNRTNVTLPLTGDDVAGSDAARLTPPFETLVSVIDPHLRTPRTVQWNLAILRALSDRQAISLTYVGARGNNLIQTQRYQSIAPDFLGGVTATAGTGRSTYQSLQLQYRGRAGRTLQALASYTMSWSKDTASTIGVLERQTQLTPSDRDLRHSSSIAVSWLLPNGAHKSMAWLLSDWGLNAIATARSGYPFSVLTADDLVFNGEISDRRASVVSGVPIAVKDASAPGGQRFNPAAFTIPADGEQGNTSRNAFRGFSSFQLDLALQRAIPLGRGMTLRVRIEAFNAFNTPVFALPFPYVGFAMFGSPISTVASGSGALYQSGGPRSVAFSTRIEF